MRTKTLFLTFAAVALLGSVRAVAANPATDTGFDERGIGPTNLVPNPGFTHPPAGWQPLIGGGVLGWTSGVDELSDSGAIELKDIPASSVVQVMSPCYAVNAGETITFGGSVKAVGGGNAARAVVTFHNSATCLGVQATETGDLRAGFPSSTWKPVQGTTVVPLGATHFRLRFQLTSGSQPPSSFYVDNVFALRGVTCTSTATTACLNGNRFRLSADWEKADGQQGSAKIVELTNDSAYLWFFKSSNIEVVAKVLDACSLNDRFWVFAAGLTDVEVKLRVTDTFTGEIWQSENPLGQAFAPIQDTGALATCPK